MNNIATPTALQLMNISANFEFTRYANQKYVKCLLHDFGHVYVDDLKGYYENPRYTTFKDIVIEAVPWQDTKESPIRNRWKYTGIVWITD